MILFVTRFIKVGFERITTVISYRCVSLFEAETGKERETATGLKVQSRTAEVILIEIYNKSPQQQNEIIIIHIEHY